MQVFDGLDFKEREKDKYKAKRRQAKINDIGVVNCIRNKNKNILV